MTWHLTFWSLVSLAEHLLALVGAIVLVVVVCASIVHKRQSEMDAHRGDYDVL